MEQRLLNCGFTPQMAVDIVTIYGSDKAGLANYVALVEFLHVSAV